MESKILIREDRHGYSVLKLNRPEVMNALSFELVSQLSSELQELDGDKGCKCAVITGNDRAFAAGADVREMQPRTTSSYLSNDDFARWDGIARFRKPLIAAVEGYALGGGCELAMLCDIIVAGENALFGQPEINLGIIPGAGGTQRLTRAVGKYMASYLIFTGERVSAPDAKVMGLVSLLAKPGQALQLAETVAAKIAAKSLPSLIAAKMAIRMSQSASLDAGLSFERYIFYSLFSTHDQKEGMDAFISKRKPEFSDS